MPTAPSLRRLLLASCLPLAACAQVNPNADSPLAQEVQEAQAAQATQQAQLAPTPSPVETLGTQTAPANGYYSNSEAAMAFADRIAEKDQLDKEWVRNTLGQARFSASAQRLMRPADKTFFKNWRSYRSRFVEPIRIQAGLRFWRQNREALERAEHDYGVPVEVILGILGVETIYGRDMGNFRVLDVLSTLAFDFPKTSKRDRSDYFKSELESFLAQAYRSGADPLAPRGSYAGAMGMTQFMPSSIQRFAVDYDGSGHIDLSNSPADAIASVAHYFKSYGWKPNEVSLFEVTGFDEKKLDLPALLAPDILPSFTPEQLEAKGVLLPEAARRYPGRLALIELQNGDPRIPGNTPKYYLGTDNFYTITRYNHSSYYAMSVLDLGAAIREQAGF